ITITGCIKQINRADQVDFAQSRALGAVQPGWSAYHNRTPANAGICQLAIVCCSILPRFVVVSVCLAVMAGCFRRTPEPIIGTSKRRWMYRDPWNAGEMLRRTGRIAEETQCNPSRSEGLVDTETFSRGWGGVARNPIGDM